MAQVELREVRKIYSSRAGREGDIEAIQCISGIVESGSFLCIVGPSGCGKSTLLEMIAGLQQPSAGEIRIAGKPTNGPYPGLAIVFQEDSLLPWRRVVDNVAFGLEIRGVPQAERHDRAMWALELVGLADFARRFPRELSGGMRQRVAIARALVTNPEVLLMDEPFGALDAQTRLVLALELLRIWDRAKVTVMFVTHDITEAVLLADRVWLLTRRPSRLKLDLKVELPRPRGPETLTHSELHEYVDELWRGLRDEFAMFA
jgi:NitT/TauT family transport system ATP-binding protein